MKWALVIPTVRPDEFEKFILAWEELIVKHDVHLIVVEDAPQLSEKVLKITEPFKNTLFSWKSLAPGIAKRTDMIRNLGFHYAYTTDCDYILTLDDDVRPVKDIFEEYEKGFERKYPFSEYFSTGSLTTSGLEMRGFPYKERGNASAVVQYGGWHGVLDYDAATQLAVPKQSQGFAKLTVPVPKGAATTCCIMNCAFRREFAPAMWQLTLHEGRYNRTGDIWSGLFQKKLLDAAGGVMLINGKASVKHVRASDPYKNIIREAPGIELNEDLWENLRGETFKEITDSAYWYFKKHDPDYAQKFIESRDQWLDLFKSTLS